MQPTSLTLMILLAIIAAVIPVGVAAVWMLGPRNHAKRWIALPLVALIIAGEAATVGAIGIRMNREYGFYDSWDSLLGENSGESQQAAPQPSVNRFAEDTPAPGTSSPTRAAAGSPAATSQGKPVLLNGDITPGTTARSYRADYTGPKSGLTGNMYVWLPPQYDDPKYKDHVFPVIIAYPGIGATDAFYWSHKGLDADNALPQAMASGKVAPFVVVMPSMRFQGHLDPECIDAPGGAKAYTWASDDVPAWIKQNLRVSPRARDWGGYGFSLGGYCALKTHLKRPDVLGSAIMFSGNFRASPDNGADAAVQRAIAADEAAREELLPVLRQADPAKVRMLVGETGNPGDADLNKVAMFKQAADEAGYGSGVQTWDLGPIGHLPALWGRNAQKFLEWTTALMRG